MQQRNFVWGERRQREIEIVDQEIGVFVDDENAEITGDAGRKRQPPHPLPRRLVEVKRQRIVDGGRDQQHQHEDRLAPDIEQRARQQQRAFFRQSPGRLKIQRIEGEKEGDERGFEKKHSKWGGGGGCCLSEVKESSGGKRNYGSSPADGEMRSLA